MNRWALAAFVVAMIFGTLEGAFRILCRSDQWGPVR